MLRFLFVSWLAVFALTRLDYVWGEDTRIDLDKLRKLVTRSPIHTRVVGGSVTTNAKLGGYLIQLHYMEEFICGATLIHELIVLTAAHCFIGRPHIKEWIAVGGASTLHDTGERREIKELVKPTAFNSTIMHMDVALMSLKKPMRGKNIGKLTLCTKPLKAGTVLTVSGWGMTDPAQTDPQELLRTVNVPVIDKRECRSVYRTATELSDTMFCAGVLGKQDACIFDSGGPIVREKEVCGIVSFGIGCAGVRYPGVYTDITYVKPFIENSMKALLKK